MRSRYRCARPPAGRGRASACASGASRRTDRPRRARHRDQGLDRWHGLHGPHPRPLRRRAGSTGRSFRHRCRTPCSGSSTSPRSAPLVMIDAEDALAHSDCGRDAGPGRHHRGPLRPAHAGTGATEPALLPAARTRPGHDRARALLGAVGTGRALGPGRAAARRHHLPEARSSRGSRLRARHAERGRTRPGHPGRARSGRPTSSSRAGA